MKIKPVFVSIAVLGVLLLLLSLSKVAQVWAANPRDVWNGTKAQPLTAQVLPKRSPLLVSLLVNPDRLSRLAQLSTPPSDRRKLRQELDNLKQQLQRDWLLNYEQDLQPWLGEELSYGVTDLDLDHQPDNGLQTGHLLGLIAKDPQKAKLTLNNFWQRLAVNGSVLGFEQYRGESIVSTVETGANETGTKAIAAVMLDKFVLFADDLMVLRQAIDNWKSPNLSLASLDNYRDRLQQIEDSQNGSHKIGVVYANLPKEITNQFPVDLLASFAVAKAGDQIGLQIHSQFNTNADAEQSINKNLGNSPKQSALNLASSIPSDSSFILGKNLSQTIQDLESFLISKSGSTGTVDSQNVLTQTIAKLLAIKPASLSSQTLAWAANDYAIALIPNASGTNDWLIVAANDAAKSADSIKLDALQSLDQMVSDQLTVGKVAIQSQPVTVWTKLKAIAGTQDQKTNADLAGTLVVAHAQTDKYIYFSNSLMTLDRALHLNKKQAITSDRHFQNLLKKLPQDAATYGYIDKVNNLLPLGNPLVQQISQHLKVAGIAIAPTYGSSNSDNLDQPQSSVNSISSEVFLAIR